MKEYKFKFRGKEIDTGKWVYGGLFKEPAPPQCFEKALEDKYWIVYPNPRYMPDWNLPYEMVRTDVNPKTIGQYTGLKDKNGKEIYEGDIVVYIEDGSIGKITWNKEEASFYISMLLEDGGYEEEMICDYINDIEVIGNIYDNPKLLKEKLNEKI